MNELEYQYLDLDELDEEDLRDAIHDEDSDYPNSIIDDEPEPDEDIARANEIIDRTMDALSDAINGASGSTVAFAKIPLNHAKMALQLLKAYGCQFQLDMDCIEYNYD